MLCENCKYAPKTYEEYVLSKHFNKIKDGLCPDAFEERAQYCNINLEKDMENNDES